MAVPVSLAPKNSTTPGSLILSLLINFSPTIATYSSGSGPYSLRITVNICGGMYMPVMFLFSNSAWIISMFFRSVSLAMYTLPPEVSSGIVSNVPAIKLNPAMFSDRLFSVNFVTEPSTSGALFSIACRCTTPLGFPVEPEVYRI